MRYLSVCSGIEAATQAWHPLGWTPVAFSEIEPFPCKVLAHHYPEVPNLGDMTKFKEWGNYDVDLLVGGTPCQSFSVAGLRKGLDDPRGNLMLTYLAIADKYKPRYIVWENVPGVLSSNGGRDFATFLEGLAELGYGWAYRVLDAQFCRTHDFPHAVPQRRRRVFVVGCLGDTGRAAAVLFDSASLFGDSAPSREAGETTSHDVAQSTFPCGGIGSYDEGDVSSPILKTGADLGNGCETICMSHGQANAEISVGFAPTLNCNHEQPIALVGNLIGRQPHNGGNGTGFDASGTIYTLTKTDVHAVAYPINTQVAMRHEALGEGTGMGIGADGDPSYTLQAAHNHAVAYRTNAAGQVAAHAVAFAQNTRDEVREMAVVGALAANPGMKQTSYIRQELQVRRLTPTECARLQGFPDSYLSQAPGASDTQMYRALGNSMAVNVMQLIGERIQYVEELLT